MRKFTFNDSEKDQYLTTGKHLDNVEPIMTTGLEALEKARRELE